MMRNLSFFAALFVSGMLSLPATAIVFGESDKLDPSFCEMKAVRQTVIYIDETIMVEGKIDWADRLNGKLTGSLVPGEPVTIVRLSPGDGRSNEVWTGCWPDYSPEQAAAISKGVYVLQRNPLEALKDQQALFVRNLGVAEGKIYMAGQRPRNQVQFSIDKAPKKQLLRALASDDGRYSNSTVPIRAIIYSDMIENSDLGSVFAPAGDDNTKAAQSQESDKAPPTNGTLQKTPVPKPKPHVAANHGPKPEPILPTPLPESIGDKLGTHLINSVFYAFGVAEDVTDGQANLQKAIKTFWSGALRSMAATVAGFGADLSTPNSKPVSAAKYDTSMKYKDVTLSGTLSLLADRNGNIVDSWIGFNRLGVTGLSGDFRCAAQTCKLDGATSGPLVETRHNAGAEMLTLNGKPSTLTGELGVKGTMMYPLEANQTKR